MSEDGFLRLKPNETVLIGRWVRKEGRLVPDDTAQRIAVLLRDWLKPVAETKDGWERLLRDPSDGRFWEVTYLKSGMHGGGPPTLRVVLEEAVRKKYGILV